MARRSKDNAIDWDAIGRQYRLGQKSNKQLGEEFGVDHSTIGKKAKALGWVIDKSKDVEDVTNSLLIQAASGKSNPNSTPSELEIKAAAMTNAELILTHRKGLRRLGGLRDKLLDQIEMAVMNAGEIEGVLEMIRNPDENGVDRLNDRLRKALDRPALIDDLKKLAEVDEKVRKGEREAFGIDKEGDKPVFEYEAVLRRVHAAKKAA